MSNVTPSYIKAHFPDLAASLDNSYIQQFITWAENEVDATIWRNLEDQGVAHLTAHYIYMNTAATGAPPGAPGKVTSEKVGDQSIGFSAPANSKDDSLGQSSYGLAYIRYAACLPSLLLWGDKWQSKQSIKIAGINAFLKKCGNSKIILM